MNDSLTCATCRVRSRVCEHVEANIKAAVACAKSQGFHEGTEEASAELLRLQNVIRTGGALYRLERAVMGIPGGHDPDTACLISHHMPQTIEELGRLIAFSRDDERRDIAAWLQYQGNNLTEQGEVRDGAQYNTAAMCVAQGAKMTGPGASALSARAARGEFPRTTPAQTKGEP